MSNTERILRANIISAKNEFEFVFDLALFKISPYVLLQFRFRDFLLMLFKTLGL